MFNDKNFESYFKTSPFREAVLGWYPFKKNAAFLEINLSGGHISKNLRGIVSCAINSFNDINDNTFDYVFLIDPDNDLTIENLMKIKSALKENGRFLLAFENPLGLRYWCGEMSPVTLNAFDSITGKDKKDTKADVETKLQKAGWHSIKWYYMIPDHWFCREVYSDDIQPNIAMNSRFSTYDKTLINKPMDEHKLYSRIIKNKGFSFFANAYFAECRLEGEACEVGYAALTSWRAKGHRFVTTVNIGPNGNKFVKKYPFDEDGRKILAEMAENHKDLNDMGIRTVPVTIDENGSAIMPFIEHETLLDRWQRQYIEGVFDENEIIKFMDRFYFTVILRSSEVLPSKYPFGAPSGALLKKAYLELIPANCFYDEVNDEFIFFDQEFVVENCSAAFVLYRGICDIFSLFSSINDNRLKEKLIKRFGIENALGALALEENKYFVPILNTEHNHAFNIRQR